LTGNFVDAETAGRIGLANHLVPHDDLVPFALGLARAIAEQPRDMVAMMRDDWNATTGVSLDEARSIHAEHQRRSSSNRSGADIASHRDEVLARSRRQRNA